MKYHQIRNKNKKITLNLSKSNSFRVIPIFNVIFLYLDLKSLSKKFPTFSMTLERFDVFVPKVGIETFIPLIKKGT